MSRAEDEMRLCPACGALPCDWTGTPPDWQAIESAPKDREVLLYCAETGEQFVAFWGTDPQDGDQQWVFARSPDVSFIVKSPTHWRDKPAAPEPTSIPIPEMPADHTAEQIPDEVIEQFCAQMQEPLAAVGKKFCDELYEDLLYSVQEYLRENAVFNIRGKFDAQQRGVVTAHKALRAVEDSTTLREAQANAYAARKGYWSEERAAEYRAEAVAEQVSA